MLGLLAPIKTLQENSMFVVFQDIPFITFSVRTYLYFVNKTKTTSSLFWLEERNAAEMVNKRPSE